MSLPAGKRDKLLTLWNETADQPDAAGQLVATYTEICQVWGEVRAATGGPNAARLKSASEGWVGYRMNANASVVITVPYDEQTRKLKTTGRVTEVDDHNEVTTYNVAGPPISDGGDLIIPAEEVV